MEEQNDFTNTGKVPYNKTLAGKSSGKSCLLAMLISAAVIAAIVIVVLLIFKPSCFQTGDRIKGSISVTLDGEPVNIESISFTGEGVGTPKIEYDNGSAAIPYLATGARR